MRFGFSGKVQYNEEWIFYWIKSIDVLLVSKEEKMKKIRLCIGSNDGKKIADTHMGDTECFY
ncbi:hypothetical protein J7M07_04805, partial [bacterium]|nr:hypothetical protein [bacterium]